MSSTRLSPQTPIASSQPHPHLAAALGPGVVLMAAALSPLFAGHAHADQPARILAHPGHRASTRLIIHPVVDPGLTIDPDLARQPTRPDLIRVRVVGAMVELDPGVDYLHTSDDRHLDDNHTLLRAQRLHRSLTAPAAAIVRGDGAPPPSVDVSRIQPRAVIEKPHHARPIAPDAIPSVPAPKPTDRRHPRITESDHAGPHPPASDA